jgi:hypothetical protein
VGLSFTDGLLKILDNMMVISETKKGKVLNFIN